MAWFNEYCDQWRQKLLMTYDIFKGFLFNGPGQRQSLQEVSWKYAAQRLVDIGLAVILQLIEFSLHDCYDWYVG